MIKAGAVDVRDVTMVGMLLAKRPRDGGTLISGVDVSVGLAKRKVFVLRAKQEETVVVEPQKSCKRSVGPDRTATRWVGWCRNACREWMSVRPFEFPCATHGESSDFAQQFWFCEGVCECVRLGGDGLLTEDVREKSFECRLLSVFFSVSNLVIH